MDRDLRKLEKEHVKMAILQQEQTFRQQVQELHRLYRVQAQLMGETEVVRWNGTLASPHTETKLDIRKLYNKTGLDQPCNSYSYEKQPFQVLGNDRHASAEDFNLELTLATGSHRIQRRKQEKSFTSDSGATISSSSTGSNVELRFHNEGARGLNIDDDSRQDELKQPPWLYQCLSFENGMIDNC